MATRHPSARKPFVSSIPLWMRTDQPRQQGMDYWKGPHSKIISATPGMEEYRQIHLAENNPALWPAISGVETVIPAERRIDGVAEVTFTSVLSPLRGRKQTSLAYKDEANVFRRTLLYAGPPYSARWYTYAGGRASRPVRSGRSSRTSLFPLSSTQGRCGNSEPRSSCPGSNGSGTRRTSRTTTPPTSGSTPH